MALWNESPLKYAPNCNTPTLFIHSDEDYRCPLPDALAMFSCLKRAGCPARLCLFHGENHELSRSGRPDNRITRLREILSWFQTYRTREKRQEDPSLRSVEKRPAWVISRQAAKRWKKQKKQ